MPLEVATYVSQLVPTNPVANDEVSQGDDHLRMLKSVLQSTFPNASRPMYNGRVSVKTADYTVLATDEEKTIYYVTTGGPFVATMPALAAGDAGWRCYFYKDGDPALFIKASAGNIFSGNVFVSRARRAIPGVSFMVWWDGALFHVERSAKVPMGTLIPHFSGVSPIGYELAYGQVLASAATDYPEFNALYGTTLLDLRGRVIAGYDSMGGVSANRLTGLAGGINGDVLAGAGGTESHVLTVAQMPAHDHTGSTGAASGDHTHGVDIISQNDTPDHTHQYVGPASTFAAQAGGVGGILFDPQTLNTGGASTRHTHQVLGNTGGQSVTHSHVVASQGSGAAHNIVQPTIIGNYLVVVE